MRSSRLVRCRIYEATFNPKRTDDLTPHALPFVGERFLWSVSWLIEEGDYVGQFAMSPYSRPGEPLPPPIGWVPECDLDDVVEVEE